jgi:hypothetical protein
VGSRSQQIPAFMQYLRSNIAKKIGRLVNWHGKFWDRRYDAEAVVDDEASVGRLRYVLSQAIVCLRFAAERRAWTVAATLLIGRPRQA